MSTTRAEMAIRLVSDRIAEIATPIAEKLGTRVTAIALLNVALQLLLTTTSTSDVVAWLRLQADELELGKRAKLDA